MTSDSDAKMLALLQGVVSRLERIEGKLDEHSKAIEQLNHTGIMAKVEEESKQMLDVCGGEGGGNVREGSLLGEAASKEASKERAKTRGARQALGAKLFTVYLFAFAGLQAASYLDLLPVFAFESMGHWQVRALCTKFGDYMWVPFVLGFAYYVIIFSLQAAMKDRPGYDLRTPLAAWSLLLAIFSVCGSLRTVPVLFKTLQSHGPYHIVCGDSRAEWVYNNPAGWWTIVFALSKVPELIDTLFIVLRKRTLITLHWYHHITVMLYCWHAWATYTTSGLIFSSMNLSVHAVMYFFYALTALGYRPTTFAMFVTVIQILQMVVGTVVTFYVGFQAMYNERRSVSFASDTPEYFLEEEVTPFDGCRTNTGNAIAGGAMYASYLWLFCAFFYFAYLRPKSKKAKSA